MVKLVKIFYALTLFLLSVYSYSQVDLSLTLSSNRFYQIIQQQLIFLGWYNRPLSAAIFSIILLLMFLNYFFIFRLTVKGTLKLCDVIHLIVITGVITLFSYPAFSYDIFNYIFDARIVVKYGLNPYNFRALDFPADSWIRFMHWTHRTYPYGPIWLAVTLPFYFFGFGKFILTLLSFRLFFLSVYLASVYFLYKILVTQKFDKKLTNLVFFAFNPLVMIETIVSPHNESLMLLGIFASIYWLGKRQNLYSYLALAASGGVKFLSWALFPLFYIYISRKLSFDRFVKLIFLASCVFILVLTFQRESYPWYFVTVMGIAALTKRSSIIQQLTIVVSFAVLLRYLPFLYFGDYNKPTRMWEFYLSVFPIISFFMIYIFMGAKRIIIQKIF